MDPTTGDQYLATAAVNAYNYFFQWCPGHKPTKPPARMLSNKWEVAHDNDSYTDFSAGVTAECRVKITNRATSCGMAGNDGRNVAGIGIVGDRYDPNIRRAVTLTGATGFSDSVELDTTQWHTYRIVWEGDYAGVYIDGETIPALMTKMFTGSWSYLLSFGLLSTGGTDNVAFSAWDYVRVYLGGPLPALPGAVSVQTPAHESTLCRTQNNEIEIVSTKTINSSALGSIPLSIKQFGSDTELGDNFTYTLSTTNVTDDTITFTETGQVLQDDSWYVIEPDNELGYWIAPFIAYVGTLRGDINRDGIIDLTDYALLSAAYQTAGSGCLDLDGDGGNTDNDDLAVLIEAWVAQGGVPLFAAQSYTKWAPDYNNDLPLIGGLFNEPDPYMLTEDAANAFRVSVRKKDASSPYMMWYTGEEKEDKENPDAQYPLHGTGRILLAVSGGGFDDPNACYDPNTFTKYGVVMDRGDPNDGDPDTFFDKNGCGRPCVIWHDNKWKMWYSGVNYGRTVGRQSIGYATSANGIHWTKRGRFDGAYRGEVFTANPTPGQFDSVGVLSPAVIYDPDDEVFKMWYQGTNNTDDPNTGVGSSGYAESDDGVIWTRQTEIGNFRSADVLKINDIYHMWYNPGSLRYAISLNGTTILDDLFNNPIISGAYNYGHQGCDEPSAIYDPDTDKLLLYYSGEPWTSVNNLIDRVCGADSSFFPN